MAKTKKMGRPAGVPDRPGVIRKAWWTKRIEELVRDNNRLRDENTALRSTLSAFIEGTCSGCGKPLHTSRWCGSEKCQDR